MCFGERNSSECLLRYSPDIGAESELRELSSHFSLVCCTHFRINILGKAMNLCFLLHSSQ